MALKKAYRRFKNYSVIFFYKELAENLLLVFSITRKAMQLKETISINKELKVLLSLKGLFKKNCNIKNHYLIPGKRTLNKALSQNMKIRVIFPIQRMEYFFL
jgi:hypothetical protein